MDSVASAGVSVRRLPVVRSVYPFVGATCAAGAGTTLWLVSREGLGWLRHEPLTLALLVIAAILADLKPIMVPHGSEAEQVSVSTTFAYALVLGWGAVAGAFALGVGSILMGLTSRRPAWKAGFNVAQFVLAVAAATLVLGFRHPGAFGVPPPLTAADLPLVLLGGVAFFVVNNTMVATAMGLAQGRSVLDVNREGFLWQASTALGLIALSPVVVVLVEWNAAILPLLFTPVVAIYVGGRASAEQARHEDRYRAMAEHAADLVFLVDDTGTITYASLSVEQALGFRPAELIGASGFDVLLEESEIPRARDLFAELLSAPDTVITTEIGVKHRDGGTRRYDVVCKNLLHNRSVGGIVVNGRDVTERRQLEAELSHQAFHDPLTKLANRALIRDRIEHALERSARDGTVTAVLFMDLDDFKNVNDSLGHAAGDEVLAEVARRIRTSLRPGDTAARFGGDEFVVLLEATDLDTANAIAMRVLSSLTEPLLVQHREVVVRASVGVAVSTAGEGTAGALLRDADVAMYAAKQNGKSIVQVYQPRMREASLERFELEADLRHVVERDELFTQYQPVVSLDTGKLVGVEALVRWTHPTRGVLSPTTFIPVAEDSGLIFPLGRKVLTEACRHAKRWADAGHRLSMAVNVSVRQLQSQGFVEDVRSVLEHTGLDASLLVLEITESALMADADECLATLKGLKALGARIAVDDFGTGYSSLAYLKRFPVDVLKIDRSFVSGLVHGAEDAALARAIIQVARTLRLTTVAEGIETAEQFSQLRALGCDLGQGYYMSRPRGAREISALLSSTNGRRKQTIRRRRPPSETREVRPAGRAASSAGI